jgi:putative LysE/RhtB family amino acid efflux pump
MSVLLYFIKSLIIGVAIAAPVGPIGMLCIRKTLELGFIGAIAVGIGAALADSIYGLVAATGLTIISQFLIEHAVIIKIVGGIFLLYLAFRELTVANASVAVSNTNKEFTKLAIAVFFLTLTNPMTILSFIGIFASIGGESSISITESIVMVIGIFVGSMLWWMILGASITKAKRYFSERHLNWIKYFAASILGCFGIISIISAAI